MTPVFPNFSKNEICYQIPKTFNTKCVTYIFMSPLDANCSVMFIRYVRVIAKILESAKPPR